jgi:excisionase family DNA binding protein
VTLDDAPPFLTIEEAARVLRIGRTAAYEAAQRGELPTVRFGRRLRVPRHALARLAGLGPEHDDGPE